MDCVSTTRHPLQERITEALAVTNERCRQHLAGQKVAGQLMIGAKNAIGYMLNEVLGDQWEHDSYVVANTESGFRVIGCNGEQGFSAAIDQPAAGVGFACTAFSLIGQKAARQQMNDVLQAKR